MNSLVERLRLDYINAEDDPEMEMMTRQGGKRKGRVMACLDPEGADRLDLCTDLCVKTLDIFLYPVRIEREKCLELPLF
jgi:hypothetical protein